SGSTTPSMKPPERARSSKIALLGLALILAATLYPYHFSSSEFVNFSNSFGLSRAIARRSNDLLVGIDAASGQPFDGKIDQLCIYARTLNDEEIARATSANDPECIIKRGSELRIDGLNRYV